MNKENLNKIKTDIDNYFNNLSEDDKFSGEILVSIKGEKIISKAFGMANYELDVPNTTRTKFRIGSVTKQFTAAAILQLYDKGLLDINDTLDRYVPNYPKGNKVTIHHLLTHTSGIFNHTSIKGFVESIMKNPHNAESLIEEFKDCPYDFEPGTKHLYSNSGFILLGYIIEKISKKSYKEYLQENIFDKLLMNDSGYDDHIEVIKNRASGYALKEDEKTLLNCDFIDMTIPYASGSLYSTVEDLYLWNNGLLEGKVISKDSLNKMSSKYADAGKEGYYGYGLFIDEIELGGKVRKKVYHGGGIPGFFSENDIFPDDDIQVIMLTNIATMKFAPKIDAVESIIFKYIQ
ncbi:serine hydrolase domain-containing protein [Clostridium sp. CTA-19]